ncbi:MAG TPA: hypothetical protein VFW45_07585 [Candidatus Polarisedimenticolia bacterium]|nr:hypothetical protein [Candidatus Polarisedimenticolia bacterium]
MRKLACLLMLLPTLAFADEIILKGGAKFTGRIQEETATMVTIDIGDGVIGVARSRIDHVVKGKSALDEYDARAAKLKPKDANGWRSLGSWAAEQGLSAQSRQAYQNVITSLPNDPVARQALGYVQHDGRWVTEDESYRAQGYVKVGGEWMTSAEAQAMDAAAAEERMRHEMTRDENLAEADRILEESRTQKAADQHRADWERDNKWGPPIQYGEWGGGWPSVPTTSNLNVYPGYKPPQPPATKPAQQPQQPPAQGDTQPQPPPPTPR